ncbi:MAG TPA: BRCT domain-containing protein [Planctomycetota bacterium]|nr:BRCT domain-containing protein [Planctomycetota bacterium]
MAKGTGGTIYLIGLIFAIIVAFVLLGIAYYMNTKWTESLDEVKRAKEDLKKEQDKVQQLNAEIAQLNKIINGNNGSVSYTSLQAQYLENAHTKLMEMLNEEYIALGPEVDLVRSQEVKDVWKYLQGFKDKQPAYQSLVDYQLDTLKQLQAVLHVIPAIWIKYLRAEEEKKDIFDRIEANRKTMQDQIDQLTAQKNRVEDEKIEAGRKFENERRQHQDDKDAKDKEISALVAKQKIEVAKLNRDLDTLNARIMELTKTRRRGYAEVAQPDGEVVFADAKMGYAWIDLGRTHNLQRGTRFQVYQNSKGGKQKVKAFIEVKKVEQDMSQCAILPDYEWYDADEKIKYTLPYENDPVVKGDLIRTIFMPDGRPIYEKGVTPKFFFIGKTVGNHLYNRNELAKKIEEFGGKVVQSTELTADVKFAVVFPKAEEEDQPNLKKAEQFGVTFISEDQLLDYIGK